MQVNSFNKAEYDIAFADTVIISAAFLLQESSDEKTVSEEEEVTAASDAGYTAVFRRKKM
jgi:hypothetical protein